MRMATLPSYRLDVFMQVKNTKYTIELNLDICMTTVIIKKVLKSL